MGKAKHKTQISNIKYAYVFERAFNTGEFIYIAEPPADSGSGRWEIYQQGAEAIMADL